MEGLGELVSEAVAWALAAPRKSPQRWILLVGIVTATVLVIAIVAVVRN